MFYQSRTTSAWKVVKNLFKGGKEADTVKKKKGGEWGREWGGGGGKPEKKERRSKGRGLESKANSLGRKTQKGRMGGNSLIFYTEGAARGRRFTI